VLEISFANEITKDCRMPGLCTYRNADRFGNLLADGSFAQKLYVFCPGKSHKDAYSGNSTTIKKPAWRRMVNPHNIETNLAHECKIDVHLLRSSEVIFFGVRLEGSIRDSLHKKLSVTLKKEFRDWANSRVCAHSGKGRDAARGVQSSDQRVISAQRF